MGVRISSRSVTKVMYMYHIHIWKNEQLPVLVPGVAVLIVHLDPRHNLCHTCNLEIRILIEKLAYKHVSYVYLKKMNYSLPWSLGLPFSLFSWTLDMTFVTLVTSEFGFSLKNWHINMYHRYIWKNELLPVLVPGVAVLVVPLDPQYCLCHTCNLKIRIPIEKLTYKHVSYAYLKKMNYSLSWSLELPFSLFPWTLDMAIDTLATQKFGFP